MRTPDSTTQAEAWKNRLQALKDLPELWTLLWQAAPLPVAATIGLRVLGGLTPLGTLYAAKHIFDLIAAASRGESVNINDLWFWVAVEFLLAALSQVTGRAIDFFDTLVADRFSRSLGLKIMRHAATLDLKSLEDPEFHNRLERARAQSTDRVGMLTSAGWLLQRIVMLLSLGGTILYYAPFLLLVLFVSVLPAFLVESHFAFLGYSLAYALTPVRRSLDYLLSLGSSREAAKEIKIFALAPHLEKKYVYLSTRLIAKNTRLAGRRLFWGALFVLVAATGYYGSYAYLVREAFLQRISIGTFTLLVGAVAGANGHLQMIFSLFSDVADQALFLRDLIIFLHERPAILSPPHPRRPPRPLKTGLEFQNVTFQYPGAANPVFTGLSFRLDKGQRVALVGENGEGKTTIVKLMTRLYDPTAGRILLDGHDLREYDVDKLRQEIGVIFQDFIRYDLTARENIAAGDLSKLNDDAALWEAARKGNAVDLLENFPKGLDQVLGRRFEGGLDLSGGEWQRVALARGFVRDAQIVILDEPTAALDPMAEYEVFQKFAELTQDRLALFISHRFSTVRTADRIILLSQGKIAEDGTHDSLIEAQGIYARLFDLQASNYR